MTLAGLCTRTRVLRVFRCKQRRSPRGLVLLALCAWLITANGAARPLFPNPVRLFEGGNVEPVGVAASDFNDDGHLDLVVGLNDGQALLILLGNGDGTFTPPVDYPNSSSAWWPAVGDFNADGNEDLAAANYLGGIDVFLGYGDGSFGPPTTYGDPEPGHLPMPIMIGDFNEDDHQDLINTGATSTEMWLGNGDGIFVPQVLVGACAGYDVVADLDVDGLDDCAGGGWAYLGNGDGTFEDGMFSPVGDGPHWTAAGDFNNDTIPDLVVTNNGSVDLSVLIGIGDGTFAPEQRYSVSLDDSTAIPSFVAVADPNGDGLQDLVVTNYWPEPFDDPAPSVSVLFGIGEGLFAPAVAADRNRYGAYSLAIGDFDGDGNDDLARPCYWCDDVNLILGKGDGSFVTVGLEPVGDEPLSVGVEDLDGDGRLDLAVVNEATSDVSVLLANGAGTFAPEERFCVVDAAPPCPAGSGSAALAVGELTGDVHPDLAVANAASDTVSILAGDGAGGFAFASSLVTIAGTAPSAIAIGDLDNDDHADVVVIGEGSRRLGVFLSNGDGTFDPPPTNPGTLGISPTALALGRLDGDGFLDVVVANVGSDDVTVLLGDGDGTFTAASAVAAGSKPRGVALGDLGADGILDLAVAVNSSWEVHVFQGSGDGSFAPPTVLPLAGIHWYEGGPHSVVIEDLDGDGRRDLAASMVMAVAVFVGDGDGSLGPEQDFATYSDLRGSLVTGDLNMDDRLDLVHAGPYDRVAFLLNQSGPTALSLLADRATLVWPAATGALSYDVYRGVLSTLVDVDDDGLPDSGYGVCMNALDDDLRDTFFLDPELPPDSGDGFFYLMSVIDAHGDGGLGTNSDGLLRLPQVPCP